MAGGIDPDSYWKTPLVDPNASGGPVDPATVTLPPISVTTPQQSAVGGAGAAGPMTDQQALIASAQRLGLSPVEWGGLMHYESGADPTRWGGSGGRHVGLIQFGPSEQKQFGVTGNESFQEQLPKAEAFLLSRGYQPGSGIMQAYSTVNAGSPNRFNASDANNGGMPGTVADKVNNQFAPHYAWANKFLGGGMQLPQSAGGPAQAAGFGLNGVTQGAAPAGGAPMVDPNSIQATTAQQPASPYSQIGSALQDAAGALGKAKQQGQQKQGGGMQLGQPYRPSPIGLQQAQSMFDPSRFFTALRNAGVRNV